MIALLEQEGEIAADYLEGLLDIADLDGDIDMDVEGDRASVSIVGEGQAAQRSLQRLVGQDGEVLEALQELTRLAVHRETGERSRLMLDVAGYRAHKRAELTALGAQASQQVKDTGEPVKLRPMTPFERKVVHDAVAAAGLRSESEGEEPQRRVVVLPA
jgi:spoIIIJ-associated protein